MSFKKKFETNHIILFLTLACFAFLFPKPSKAEDWLTFEYFLNADLEEIIPYPKEELPLREAQADEENNSEVQYVLARMYEKGLGVKQDKVRAEKLYLSAASNNLLKAQIAVAVFYNFKGDITKSRKWFNEAAKSGSPVGQFQLGLFYELGRGVFQNMEKALKYYEQSSQMGYVKATLKLAEYYQESSPPNLKKAITYYKFASKQADDSTKLKISILLARLYADIAEAQGSDEHVFKWLLKAAELGDLDSQVNVAAAYLNGQGVETDYEKSIEWYNKAAYRGDTKAMTMLGYVYSNGIGVEINFEEAVRWYRHASERGNGEAAWNLANMYLAGNGVPQDKEEAKKWFRRAEVLRKRTELLEREKNKK